MTHSLRGSRSGRLAGVVAVLGLVLVSAGGVPVASAIGTATRAATAREAASAASSATQTKKVERYYVDGGKKTVVDQRTVTVTVNATQNLKSLQLVDVTWTGAHPTGGVVADQNSDSAQVEEYPFVLLECRGTDSTAHPLTPETCWTQYPDERFSYGYDDPAWPDWRSDAEATPAERAVRAGAPKTIPQYCKNLTFGDTFERWLPFTGADGHVYPGGLFGCAGIPAEATPENFSGGLALPSNETFGVTSTDGAGAANFDIFTAEDHASLGCSQTVRCSLVAIPIMGIDCDSAGSLLPADQRPSADEATIAQENCETAGNYAAGAPNDGSISPAPAVGGVRWWAPSNWRNRFSFPLTFSPPDNACQLQSSQSPTSIYGSELATQATTQWAPAFCLNSKLFNLNHVQVPEPQARNLLAQGGIDAAFTSRPPDTPYPMPVVNAPTAVSGFGIAFTVDDANGRPLSHLRLDARLLAKLLTQSYPVEVFIKNGHPGLENNPYNITQDPEFRALNPTVKQLGVSASAAGTLLTVNTDSDVIYALTSYIDADPEARAWLDGTPDPWGMTVNPAYKKISLPVDNWPLLDTYEPLEWYQAQNPCLFASPVPYLPLIAAPTARLFSIAQDVQFSIAQSTTKCVQPDPLSVIGAKLVATGRQPAGFRFMLGVVSLGDAYRSSINLASLQTRNSGSTTAKFSGSDGRTFVDPDAAGLRAAAKLLQPDAANGTWNLPYDKIATSAIGEMAYPGTMVIYTAVPTIGVPKTDARHFSQFLTYAAGRGQQAGGAPGQLAAGFLPMTSANGLGAVAAYTLRAAKAVAAQVGYLPSLTKPDPAPSSPPPTRPTGSAATSGPAAPAPGTGPGPVTATAAPLPRTTTGKPNPSTSGTPAGSSPAPSLAAYKTPSIGSGVGGWALPALLLLAAAAAAGLVVTRLVSRGTRQS